MRFVKLTILYVLSFFAVAWACGHPPLDLSRELPVALSDISVNRSLIGLLPGGANPFSILVGSFLIGSIVAIFLERNRKAVLQNIVFGLIVLHFVFYFFQIAGLISDLDKDFDVSGWRLVKVGHYWSGPENPKILAERIKLILPRSRMKLDFQSDFPTDKDPYFYLGRSLAYHLYPVDIRGVRSGISDGCLFLDVYGLPGVIPSEYKTVLFLEKGVAVALKEDMALRR